MEEPVIRLWALKGTALDRSLAVMLPHVDHKTLNYSNLSVTTTFTFM